MQGGRLSVKDKNMDCCPFCGGPAKVYDKKDDIRGHRYIPTCEDKHCLSRNQSKYYPSYEAAVIAWNDRKDRQYDKKIYCIRDLIINSDPRRESSNETITIERGTAFECTYLTIERSDHGKPSKVHLRLNTGIGSLYLTLRMSTFTFHFQFALSKEEEKELDTKEDQKCP